jgi:hypothetical protein
LLGKDLEANSETTAVACLTGKHTNNIQAISSKPTTTIEKLLKMVFSARSEQNGYKEDNCGRSR